MINIKYMLKEDLKSNSSELFNDLKYYLNLRSTLLRYTIYEGFCKLLANAITFILSFAIILMVLIFCSLALSVWLKDVFGSYIPGFLIIAGFYLIIFILVIILKNKIILNPLLRKVNEIENEVDHPLEGGYKVNVRNENDILAIKSKLRADIKGKELEINQEYKALIDIFSVKNLVRELKEFVIEFSESMIMKAIYKLIDIVSDKIKGRRHKKDVEDSNEDED